MRVIIESFMNWLGYNYQLELKNERRNFASMFIQ